MKKTILLIIILLVPIILSAQTQRWIYRYAWPGNNYNGANYVLYGPDNNIYTAGYTVGTYTYTDFLMASLTPTGSQRWVYYYNRYEGHDIINAFIWGGDNNLYAAGDTSYTLGDMAILKMTPTDSVCWMYFYNGPANYADEAFDVVYGADGNIYACGYTGGIGTDLDFTVISIDTLGTFRWVYRYNGNANGEDIARSIVYGNDGNLYVTGITIDTTNHQYLTVISLTTSGNQRWIYKYDGTAHRYADGNSIIWGSDGNLYVAGKSSSPGNTYDFTVLSLTPAGNERWVYNTHGTDVWADEAKKIVYGSDGNLYAVGTLSNASTYNDIFAVSFTPAGTVRWQNCLVNDGMDASSSICMGADGNIYIAGYLNYPFPALEDFSVISLTSAGSLRWTYNYNGLGNSGDAASSVIYGNDGNLYAVGASADTIGSSKYTVISLNPASGVEENHTLLTTNRLPLEIYPNPASSFFVVRCPSFVKNITIFDVTGKMVREVKLPMGSLTSLSQRISLDGIKNGIYFVQIGDRIIKEKLVVTK